ncbi:hypothetical protein [Paenibacillus cymbidii]|uniref:hypothetical protein n=1 Tax=Paenibacillus cymbidii TaxID=1639034 RepID=UPI0010817E72|nr:hypothetical protein [Paenibacillus cymbidii]
MRYTFRTPAGNKTLVTNRFMSEEERMELWLTVIYQPFEEWLLQHKHSSLARRLLSDCANYLIKDTNGGTTLTPRKIEQVRMRELTLSSLRSSDQASDSFGDNDGVHADNARHAAQGDAGDRFQRSIYHLRKQEQDRQRHASQNQRRRYVQSRAWRMAKLYSTPKTTTYVVDQVGEERNVFSQPVVDVRTVTVGGHKGIVGIRQPYVAQWCVIDTEGCFTFHGTRYTISPKLRRYRVSDKWNGSVAAERRAAYGGSKPPSLHDVSSPAADWTNRAVMDRILCFRIDERSYFFDQNINKINKKYIRAIESAAGIEFR